ncbi:hypothetical protein RMN56_19225 [Micromonospora halotolerans]|uniref:Uncharacterized protein n=2 Tax=Micromonospora halotolerans TaxID=709879 RepID=A0ABZ0A734_9ACTN|nr:hypothetical protein [Micromonospora halotolerans]WNM43060.1 hypothetical protein RMN56_19225 [Micromonospora halotolerans]
MGRLAGGGLAAAVAGALVHRHRRRAPTAVPGPRCGRWEVVTVAGRPEEVLPPGCPPEPLHRLGDAVELSARPAPGGRGTELAARLPGGPTMLPGLAAHLVGDDPGRFLRQALRETQQLVETGEVLRADRSPLERPAAG